MAGREMEFWIAAQFAETSPLQPRIVIVIEVVEAMNGPAVGQEPARQMKADEAGSTGDKNWLLHSPVPPQSCGRLIRGYSRHGRAVRARGQFQERPRTGRGRAGLQPRRRDLAPSPR